MDSRAAIAALIGVAIGTAVAVCVGNRQWRDASAIGAFGTVFVLVIVTEGSHSRLEHNVVLGVGLFLLACSVVATEAGRRTRRRDHL